MRNARFDGAVCPFLCFSTDAGTDHPWQASNVLEPFRTTKPAVPQAAAWMHDTHDPDRVASCDERLADALMQSQRNLASVAVRFEKSHQKSTELLAELRGWLDAFTGTARPEDTNPIAAMLPDPGLEGEVATIMRDCQVEP